MPDPQYSISTPENVDLHMELAGFGNRVLACIIDTLWIILLNILLFAGLLGAWLALKQLSLSPGALALWSTCLLMAGVTVSFVIVYGYYLFFEGMWQGQTPGKKFVDIRVIEQTGQPITWSSAIVRNLMRLVDQGVMLIGFISMLIDKNERRLGDFAAGTIVIRERTPNSKPAVILIDAANKNATLDVGRITPDEYDLLTTFLKRREKLSAARPVVAKQLDKYFKHKLGAEDSQASPENFLESIYATYQSRAE
jgi:uncharacterized RDD family membrane protein YckC